MKIIPSDELRNGSPVFSSLLSLFRSILWYPYLRKWHYSSALWCNFFYIFWMHRSLSLLFPKNLHQTIAPSGGHPHCLLLFFSFCKYEICILFQPENSNRTVLVSTGRRAGWHCQSWLLFPLLWRLSLFAQWSTWKQISLFSDSGRNGCSVFLWQAKIKPKELSLYFPIVNKIFQSQNAPPFCGAFII